MGGCRCVFRDCAASTIRIPGLHFFHFPVKDSERMTKWLLMSGRDEDFLDLTPQQQKNRVVCARHFHDTDFMNYKKDRLDRNAVPTLMRLTQRLAIDFKDIGKEELPKLINLTDPIMPHLIPPPKFKCPLELEDEDDIAIINELTRCGKVQPFDPNNILVKGEYDLNTHTTKSAEKRHSYDIGDEDGHKDLPNKSYYIQPVTKKPKLSPMSSINTDNCELALCGDGADVSPDCEDYLNDLTLMGNCEVYKIDDIELSDEEKTLTITALCNTPLATESSNSNTEEKIEQPNSENSRIKQLEEELVSVRAQLRTCQSLNRNLSFAENELRTEKGKLQQDCEDLQRTNNDLELEMEAFMRIAGQSQNATVSTTKECNCTDAQAAAVQPPKTATAPTKAQLFNGIKKYLGASMISLLRMEMFGSHDRQWKPDERRISADLLRLGENIYRYLSDEWRFRLPALSQTREWLKESSAADGLEEDEDI